MPEGQPHAADDVGDSDGHVLGLVVAAVFAPLQEAWLGAWGTYGGGSSFVRFVASALPAAVTGALLFWILPRIERFAGLREEVEG